MEIQEEFGKQINENMGNFIFAGNSVFTLLSLKTGKHYTYHVKKGKKYFFVTVRHGDDWTQIGSIRIEDLRVFKPYGQQGPMAPSMQGLAWFLKHLDSDQVEFYHMGRCAACGLALTNPESIETGYGPVCRDRIFG